MLYPLSYGRNGNVKLLVYQSLGAGFSRGYFVARLWALGFRLWTLGVVGPRASSRKPRAGYM